MTEKTYYSNNNQTNTYQNEIELRIKELKQPFINESNKLKKKGWLTIGMVLPVYGMADILVDLIGNGNLRDVVELIFIFSVIIIIKKGIEIIREADKIKNYMNSRWCGDSVIEEILSKDDYKYPPEVIKELEYLNKQLKEK